MIIHFLSTLHSPALCGFLSLTIFIHFIIHIVIHIFIPNCCYPQNVDNLWITFPIYSHSFIRISKKSLFFNGFRPVGNVFIVIHTTHIPDFLLFFPHNLSSLSTRLYPHTPTVLFSSNFSHKRKISSYNIMCTFYLST